MRSLLFIFVSVLAMPIACAYPAYHDISDTAAAQAEARERNLPLAYLGSFPECLIEHSPDPATSGELSQLALNTLQGRAVVIFFDGHNMRPVPDFIHAQYHIADDGPLPGEAAWDVPKIVFADPHLTKILGRVSRTQLTSGREAPLEAVLKAIASDPASLTSNRPVALPMPESTSDETETTAAPAFGTQEWATRLVMDRWPYFAVAGGVILLAAIAAVGKWLFGS